MLGTPGSAAVKKILVLGSGIIGLTTALRLLEQKKHHVTLWSTEPWERSTSSKAAALWEPYRPDINQTTPEDVGAILRWGQAAYRRFRGDVGQVPGVKAVKVLELRRDAQPLWWTEDEFLRDNLYPRFLETSKLHDLLTDRGPYVGAYIFESIVIDMSQYLAALQAKLMEYEAQKRVEINTNHPVDSGSDTQDYHVIVNCAGLGARAFVDEGERRRLQARRGQIVRLQRETFPEFTIGNDKISVFLDIDQPTGSQGEITYIVPRFSDIVLGGTFELLSPEQEEVMKEKERRKEPTWAPATRDGILTRSIKLLESLKREHMQDYGLIEALRGCVDTPNSYSHGFTNDVGLRPLREPIRVARDDKPQARGQVLIHNYGHGGAGVTLSWGCADEVVQMIPG
jgi:D-amino-acid oxidase